MPKSWIPGEAGTMFEDSIEYVESRDLDIAEWNVKGSERYSNADESVEFVENKLKNYYPDKSKATDREAHHEHLIIMDAKTGNVESVVKGGKYSVSITEKAREKIKGSIVTHNHPSSTKGGNGGPPSFADVKQLSLGMSELRAVSREGTYSFKISKNSDVQGFINRMYADRRMLDHKMAEVHDRCQKRAANGYYKTKRAYYQDNANRQLAVIHRYYMKTAEEYGVHYSFTEDPVQAEAIRRETYKLSKKGKNNRRISASYASPTGSNSTRVMGTYRDQKTGKEYVHYKTHNKFYVTDGKTILSGDKVQEQLNRSQRTGVMSSDSFRKWKEKKRKTKK